MFARFQLSSVVGLALLVCPALVAQVVVPVGIDFQVNTYTSGDQDFAEVAVDADGDFVIVWASLAGQDGSSTGVFGRRFNSAGTALAAEFQVNSYITGIQISPAAAWLAGGSFVVAWESAQDGSSAGIFARRFDAAGSPLATELQINTYTTGGQSQARVDAAADGDFVVAWQGAGAGDVDGIFARRFNSSGAPVAAEFRVNSVVVDAQNDFDLDVNAAGAFVVAWTSLDAAGNGIFVRQFNSSGGALGIEFQVNSYFTGEQTSPVIGLDTSGGFTVAWSSDQSGSGRDVIARRFDSTGTPTTGEFQVNTYNTSNQYRPSLAADADGDFVITWDRSDVFARRFQGATLLAAPEIVVQSYTSASQGFSAVDSDGHGGFVVAWVEVGARDGDEDGVFARRFTSSATIDIDGDGQYLPLTDGLLLLRFGFGFGGNTLIAGAVGPGCTRCDAPSITAYLQGLI